MEVRLLRSFLAIAEEGNITRAADSLHLTQPALSRQLSLLENELGTPLFKREKREMVLTDEGMLLKRRASEIIQLVELTEGELKDAQGNLEGTISIGAGELFASEVILDAIDQFARTNPMVHFEFLTGVADQVIERLDRGLLDLGLLMEPVDVEKYSFVRLHQKERWVAVVNPDDPLAGHTSVTSNDLIERTLILPSRPAVHNEIAQWFGRSFKKADVRYTVNLGGIRAGLVKRGMGVLLSVEGSTCYWDPKEYVSIPLSPNIEGGSFLAWKRGATQTKAVSAFLKSLEDTF